MKTSRIPPRMNRATVGIAVVLAGAILTGCASVDVSTAPPAAGIKTDANPDKAVDTKPKADPGKADVETPAPEDPKAKQAKLDKTQAKAIKKELLEIFGVKRFSDLISYDATMWIGYVSKVKVDHGDLYVTIQEDDAQLGEDAAQALSTLLSAKVTSGLGWVIVENGAGEILAQRTLDPIM